MRRRIAIRVVSATVLILWACAAQAAVPDKMAVQGRLTDSSGVPLPAGDKTLSFSIHDDVTGGAQVWPASLTEDQVITTGNDGLWLAFIGAIEPLSEAVFADSARWLEITVDDGINAPVMLPRVRLATGPFAYRVATVDGALGGAISSTVLIGTGNSSAGPNGLVVGNSNSNGGIAGFVAGELNHTGDDHSGIASGFKNATDERLSFIGGGDSNGVYTHHGAIVGGRKNLAGRAAFVGGGERNGANGDNSIIGGGLSNTADGNYATIGGGKDNYASGLYATVAGGGPIDATTTNSAEGDGSVVGGGGANHATGLASVVAGGKNNEASLDYATASGGRDNSAEGYGSAIGGGILNTATGTNATVGGGIYNSARGSYSVVAGGGGFILADSNLASGASSAVCGGRRNYATGDFATVPGGLQSQAAGNYSFAAGRRAKANYPGSFVWADDIDADFADTDTNQFIIRASGGVGVGEQNPLASLHVTKADVGPITTTFLGGTGVLIENDPYAKLALVGPETGGAQVFFGFPSQPSDAQVSYSAATRGLTLATGATSRMYIGLDGNIKIGSFASTSSHILEILQFSATDPIADAWTTYSSRRWKKNIVPIEGALDKVQRLRGVEYDWKKNDAHDIGLIAEEVGEVIPEVVAYEENGVDAQSVDYARLVAVLIEAVKQQQKQIDELRTMVESQSAER